MLIFSGIFYGVYAFFREQACTVVCPYGRLQSVLLDRNSMIVAYDYKRGEPRGKFTKKKDSGLLCVLVVILAALLISRKEVDATIMRTPGMLYQERETDSISNLYTIKIANKTIRQVPLQLRLEDAAGSVQIIGRSVIPARREEEGSGNFFVILPREEIRARKTVLHIALYDGNRKIDVIRTSFLGRYLLYGLPLYADARGFGIRSLL